MQPRVINIVSPDQPKRFFLIPDAVTLTPPVIHPDLCVSDGEFILSLADQAHLSKVMLEDPKTALTQYYRGQFEVRYERLRDNWEFFLRQNGLSGSDIDSISNVLGLKRETVVAIAEFAENKDAEVANPLYIEQQSTAPKAASPYMNSRFPDVLIHMRPARGQVVARGKIETDPSNT